MAGLQQEQICSQTEAAKLSGVSRQRIYQLMMVGRLRYVTLQGRLYVTVPSLREFIKAREARAVTVDTMQLRCCDE